VYQSQAPGAMPSMWVFTSTTAGWPEATLYPGSWSDWSTAGFPVATGAEPGTSTGAPAESSAPPP